MSRLLEHTTAMEGLERRQRGVDAHMNQVKMVGAIFLQDKIGQGSDTFSQKTNRWHYKRTFSPNELQFIKPLSRNLI